MIDQEDCAVCSRADAILGGPRCPSCLISLIAELDVRCRDLKRDLAAASAERDESDLKREALRRENERLKADNKQLTEHVTTLQITGTAHVEERRCFLNALAAVVHEVSASKGWWDIPVSVEAFAANVHGEVSELFEAYRRRMLYEPCDKAGKMNEPLTCFEEEMADIIIRVLDMAAAYEVDMDRAVRAKTAFNRTREYRHGGKVV